MSTVGQKSWLIFLAGGAVGAGLAWLCLKTWNAKGMAKDKEISRRQQHVGPVNEDSFLKDEIVQEQLTRNLQFFGEGSQLAVSRSLVVVVGLGGVGSHAAHLLLRSGVRRLRLVDFDLVSLSSLNRHAVATRSDVGTLKTACLEKHFREILPEVVIEVMPIMYSEESEEAVLGDNPDYVIDAIDNTDTKVALLRACHQRGIRVLCIGGAGAKADPTRVRFADINECSSDPLCRTVRHRLRRLHNITTGIPVLLSTEKPRCELLSLGTTESQNPLDYQIVPNFRVRTIPVLGTAPAFFGMAAASHVLCHLAGTPFQSEPIFNLPIAKCQAQYDRLLNREELRIGSAEEMFVDLQEWKRTEKPLVADFLRKKSVSLSYSAVDKVTYLVREVWRGVSAKSLGSLGNVRDKGLCRNTDQLVLTRWDSRKPALPYNLVLLEFAEADKHDEMSLDEVKFADNQFYTFVENTLNRVRNNF